MTDLGKKTNIKNKTYNMKYIYADITIHPYSETACDIISAMLGEIGYDSFEMTEKGLKAYIAEDIFEKSALESALKGILFDDTTLSFTIHELENRNWNEEWEQNSFTPILEHEFGIKLSPKMAFGSGAHETTHQIVSILMQEDFTGKRVLDMGTGTGVLAIAMSLRGAHDVTAIDIDEFSVANAKENLALNGICSASVIHGDASSIKGKFDVIVANIHKNILKNDMDIYLNHLVPNGTLFISGFFTSDVPEMTATAKEHNLAIENITSKNDWAVMRLKKTSRCP